MVEKSELKFYLTSLEPNISQTPSQSLGGYPSSTEFSISAILSASMGILDTTATIDGNIGESAYAVVGEEIMRVIETEAIDDEYGASESITIERGSVGTTKRFHAAGDLLFTANKNLFFNGSLSNTGKQYRCVAIRNASDVDTFYNIRFYIKNPSRNPKSSVRISVEFPKNEIINSVSTSGTSISLTDTSLINYDSLVGRLLVIDDPTSLNINTARAVASYDSNTGVITFRNSMPYPIASNTTYRIDQSPSQRIISGRMKPALGELNNSVNGEFSSAIGSQGAISIDDFADFPRPNGVDLKPFETVYLWLERDISLNTDRYDNNRVVFTAVYNKTQQ